MPPTSTFCHEDSVGWPTAVPSTSASLKLNSLFLRKQNDNKKQTLFSSYSAEQGRAQKLKFKLLGPESEITNDWLAFNLSFPSSRRPVWNLREHLFRFPRLPPPPTPPPLAVLTTPHANELHCPGRPASMLLASKFTPWATHGSPSPQPVLLPACLPPRGAPADGVGNPPAHGAPCSASCRRGSLQAGSRLSHEVRPGLKCPVLSATAPYLFIFNFILCRWCLALMSWFFYYYYKPSQVLSRAKKGIKHIIFLSSIYFLFTQILYCICCRYQMSILHRTIIYCSDKTCYF